MKLFLKIIGGIVSILILAFLALATYFYFNPDVEEVLTPEQIEINKIYDSVDTQTGNLTINSIDQIGEIIIPLAKQIIVRAYPELSGRTFGKLIVLEEDAFTLKVTEEFVRRNMSEEESLKSPVVVDRLGGTTFCPGADVYYKYLGPDLYNLEYLHIAVHELLHALTCESKISKTFPAVWEESFTEYFTMRVLSKYIGTDAEIISSSPERLKIIRGLSKFIRDDELFRMYMTKDGAALKRSIDNRLGAGSYESLYTDMEIVFRQSDYTYIENGSVSNPRVDEALRRINDLIGIL